jgi:hypothetical protein
MAIVVTIAKTRDGGLICNNEQTLVTESAGMKTVEMRHTTFVKM